MNMVESKSVFHARKLTLGALLTAIVVVLQVLANFIQPVPGVSITLVLVPIIVGAALLGPVWGGWLGLVFALTVLLSGGATTFLTINSFGTIVTVIVKGVLAGMAAGLVYGWLSKKNQYLAIFCAAVTAPVVNTGIFLIGCRLFFWNTITEWGKSFGYGNPFAYAILGLAGINFLVELGINCLMAPVILRLIRIKQKQS